MLAQRGTEEERERERGGGNGETERAKERKCSSPAADSVTCPRALHSTVFRPIL